MATNNAINTGKPIEVGNGGTGATTFTAHGVIIGEAGSALAATTAGTTGQVLIGSTGADPAFGALGVNSGLTAHGVLLGENNSAIVATTAGTNGQVLLGSTGADPAFGTLTSSDGSITFTTGAGSLSLQTAGGGTAWTEVTGTTVSLAVNNGYAMNNAALITATLPATAAFGSIIRIVGKGAGGWKIAQNAGQTINFGNLSTTTGTGGYLASTLQYDCIEMVCITADTSFVVRSSIGNITVV